MSNPETFSAEDWPSEEHGLTIHYNPDTSKPPLARGVLHASSRGKPSVQWQELMDCFNILRIIPNYISFLVPVALDEAKRIDNQARLSKAFALSFPHKVKAAVSVYLGRKRDVTYISFNTPASNVRASDIITAAVVRSWNVAGHALGTPWYVGFQTNKAFHPLKFKGVPNTRKDDFIAALPQYLTETLDPAKEVEVLDIWEVQSRASKDNEWTFGGEVVVLLCIKNVAVTNNSLGWLVTGWPGWYHFEEEHLIELAFPGRFAYCKFCKHTAQDLDGPNQRHSDEACIRIVCPSCGHNGHDITKTDATGYNKRACEEGKAKRAQERELKRQKIAHEAEMQQTTQNGAEQQSTENETETQESSGTAEDEDVDEDQDAEETQDDQQKKDGDRQRQGTEQSEVQVKAEV